MTTYLEQAAAHVRLVEAAAAKMDQRAALMRLAAGDVQADALEWEALQQRMWLADRCIALAAIEAGLPPCCCTGRHEPELKTGT